MLRETVERCREALPDMTILSQGDAPNPVLQRRFLAEEHSCLFATASFWTGMSSPGTTCSAVVLDKIPFPVPSDPIVEARSELVGDQRAFMEVSVPAAGMQPVSYTHLDVYKRQARHAGHSDEREAQCRRRPRDRAG